MSPEIMIVEIVNWLLGVLALICVVLLMIFPLATIISAIVEGSKQLGVDQRRSWKITKIFGILSLVGIVGLIVILMAWGVAVYALRLGL